ncbi:NAD(P)H-hydrate dehydratase [Rosenbergiella australiborealis]|uniref:NAD(P)H-hydrate dehydratase n=1 Tax=Rosenbergiella australiborealis TaxID=1544696 RepID=UPI001F4DEE6A|nr:NAD(P)H-hydrate dehydratase [Rosenbergiella australiborealis]
MRAISMISDQLPSDCWPVQQIAELEQHLCQRAKCSPYQLMWRAGEALLALISQHYATTQHCLVLCGRGNNGGDGFVLAYLLRQAGVKTTVVEASLNRERPSEATQAQSIWHAGQQNPSLTPYDPWPTDIDLVVDALYGIGLRHAPQAEIQSLIDRVNTHRAPVVSVDIPSGLDAQTGQPLGRAIYASSTLTFITLKPGLLTGKGRDHTGKLYLADLGFGNWCSDLTAPIQCLTGQDLCTWLPQRAVSAHKGDMGKVVLIGGAEGSAGAIRLSGEAALRSGAGLVRVLTHHSTIMPILAARPELMVAELTPESLNAALEWADVIAIGPGLGQSDWAKNALNQVKLSKKIMLWDADALNLLAIDPDKRQNRVLTPHPGEAARLLGISIAEVEADRLSAANRLVERFGGIAVLKGSGTIIADDSFSPAIAYVGNPGMATGGMGDVLTGVITAFIGQGLELSHAARAGVVAHGHAADLVAEDNGMRGMLALDVVDKLRISVNPLHDNDD